MLEMIPIGMLDFDRLEICDNVANKGPLSIGPFSNTHKVSEISPKTLMGDYCNQVFVA